MDPQGSVPSGGSREGPTLLSFSASRGSHIFGSWPLSPSPKPSLQPPFPSLHLFFLTFTPLPPSYKNNVN